jgi:streptomycin 6-kinase
VIRRRPRPGVGLVSVPEAFAATVRAVWGAAGDAWLAALPDLVAELAERWQLAVGARYELSYHWVAAAERTDRTPVVLRLGVPGSAEDEQAAAALALVDGNGLCRLLDWDPAAGAMLLARVEPGRPLSELGVAGDAAATAVLLDVARRLQARVRVDPGDRRWPARGYATIPTMARRGRAFDRLRGRHAGGTGPLPAGLVDDAERTWADLAGPPPGGPVLLHGDLHHYNVLSSGRAGWLAIDPKPALGAPLHEIGPMLLNPVRDLLSWPDPAATMAARIDQIADALAVPARDVRRWARAHAALSAAWSDEDGEPPDYALACAELVG